MKASYCNTIAEMHEIRHGSKSVASVNCDGSITFCTADSWHSCRTGSLAIALQYSPQLGMLCHIQGGLGKTQKVETGTFKAQQD